MRPFLAMLTIMSIILVACSRSEEPSTQPQSAPSPTAKPTVQPTTEASVSPKHESPEITAGSFSFPPERTRQETLDPVRIGPESIEFTRYQYVDNSSDSSGPVEVIDISGTWGPDGDVWFGTTSGVLRFDGEKWNQYRLVDGERLEFWEDFPPVLSLTVSPDGDLIAGACGGIYQFRDESWFVVPLTDADFFGRNCFGPVAVGPEGDLWFSIWDGQTNGFGIFHLSDGGLTRYTDDYVIDYEMVEGFPEERNSTEGEWLPDNFVTTIITDLSGAVWIASGGETAELSRFDGQEWTTISGTDYLLGEFLSATKGPDGSLWFHTDQGFSHFDGETWITYLIREKPMNYVSFSHSTIDGLGNFWFFDDSGSYHFDGGTLIFVTVGDEEPSSGVLPIADFDEGGIWLAGDEGFVRINLKDE